MCTKFRKNLFIETFAIFRDKKNIQTLMMITHMLTRLLNWNTILEIICRFFLEANQRSSLKFYVLTSIGRGGVAKATCKSQLLDYCKIGVWEPYIPQGINFCRRRSCPPLWRRLSTIGRFSLVNDWSTVLGCKQSIIQ